MTINWICNKSGCFAKEHIPDHNVWDGCFPGRISMTDIDQIAELSGWFCAREWKDGRVQKPPDSQVAFFRNFCELVKKGHTLSNNITFFIYGHTGKTIIERFELMLDIEGQGAMIGPMTSRGSSQANFEAIAEYHLHWSIKVSGDRMKNDLRDRGFSEELIHRLEHLKTDFEPKVYVP